MITCWASRRGGGFPRRAGKCSVAASCRPSGKACSGLSRPWRRIRAERRGPSTYSISMNGRAPCASTSKTRVGPSHLAMPVNFALGGKQLAGSDDLSRMQLTICAGAQVHTAKAHQSGASCQLFAPGRKGWWRAPWTSEYERVLIGPSPAVLMPCSSPRARRPSCGSAPPRPAPRPTSPSPLRTPTSWPASHASPRRAELRRRRGQARLVERPSAADRPRAPAVPARRACQWVSVSDRSPAPAGAFRRWVAAESSWTRPMQHPCRRTGQNHPLPRKKVMAPTTASVMSPNANG